MSSYFSSKNLLTKLFKWFPDNQMKTNEDKSHLIVSTNELTEIQIENFSNKSSGSERLLGVNIDSKLNFDCDELHRMTLEKNCHELMRLIYDDKKSFYENLLEKNNCLYTP